MPCDSIEVDELGHTYNFSGPYYLDCGEEWINFNHTDTVEVYHNDRCCNFKNADSGWENAKIDTVEKVQKGRDYKVSQIGCGPCKNWAKARCRCTRRKQSLQRCHYNETPLKVVIDNQEVKVLDSFLSVSPILQAPYGLWRNETSIFLNTASQNFLEGMNFNYSCIPSGGGTGSRENFVMPQLTTLNPLPQMVQCMVVVKVPFLITNGSTHFCTLIQITENLETGGFGFKTSDTSQNCAVKIKDDKNMTFYIILDPESYRFFLEARKVAYQNIDDGVFIDCNDLDFQEVIAKPMSYDYGNEIEIVV
jgi:hypothetical protein